MGLHMEIKESTVEKLQETFLNERYKHILNRKNDLNEKTFKIVSLYQVILFGFVISFYNIYSNRSLSGLTKYFCNGLVFMLIISTILLILLLIGGILAWLDTRNEESELMKNIFNRRRDKVRISHIFRWYETYIIFSLTLTTSCISLSYFNYYNIIF